MTAAPRVPGIAGQHGAPVLLRTRIPRTRAALGESPRLIPSETVSQGRSMPFVSPQQPEV